MQRAEYRQLSRETWERMAPGWARHVSDSLGAASRPVDEWLVRRLDPQPGETILELGAGTGDTGFSFAGRLGPSGRLISTDFASQMVEVARARGADLGVDNAEFHVLDAERMELPDSSVNGVVCRFAYMLMADPAAAARETRRVLTADGRVACAVWGGPDRNPWASAAGRVLVARGHMTPPQPGEPGIFALAAPGALDGLLAGAGFEQVEMQQLPLDIVYPDFEAYWDYLNHAAGAISPLLAALDANELAAVRADVADAVVAFADERGLAFPGLAVVALAR